MFLQEKVVERPVSFINDSASVALRNITVTSQAELDAAIKDRKAGDHIYLKSGTYKAFDFGYNITGRATPENLIVFIGGPDVFILGANLIGTVHDVWFININFTNSVILNFGCSALTFLSCTFTLQEEDKKNSIILIKNSPVGNNRWINCHFQGNWELSDGFYSPSGYGIKWLGCNPGDNNLITGCTFCHIGRDAISFNEAPKGGTYDETPSKNNKITWNLFYLISDDAIEVDGWNADLEISNNIIGGTKQSVLAGISIAPGGPGPIIVKRNSISGYNNLPIKFNTEVMEAFTKNVTITENRIVGSSEASKIIWYFGIPANKLSDCQITNNDIIGHGALLISENTWHPDNFIIDYNSYYTSMLDPHLGTMFRIWDPNNTSGNGNNYYYTFDEWQEAQKTLNGFDQHSEWNEDFKYLIPKQIGNIPIEYLCEWTLSHEVLEPPTSDPVDPPNPPIPLPTDGILLLDTPYKVEVTGAFTIVIKSEPQQN